MCRAWIVGWATCSSEVYAIYVQCTYVKVSLLGSLHGAGEPGQGFRAVDCQRLNNGLSDIVLTLHYAGHPENARMEVWGVARKVARRGERPKVEMCRAWTVGWATCSGKVSAIYVQRMYMKVSLLGSLHGAGKLGQGFRAVDCQRLNNGLSDIAITLQYAGNLENARMEVWGATRKAVRREGGSPKSRCATCGLWC